MKLVKIKILNKQTFPDGRKEKIKHEGKGKYNLKNDKHYLVYNENNKGLEDVETILKFNEEKNRVLMQRSKPRKTRQVFDVNESCLFEYAIGRHKMKFLTETKSLKIETSKNKGIIKIKYNLLQNQEIFAENSLKVEYSFIDEECSKNG
jgi:uncharacterized beta-barrel protein YwiB (DUF1934 family)